MWRGHKYLCRDVLTQVAKRHSIRIVSLGIDDGHVDMVATIQPATSMSKAFQLLKSASSYVLFRTIPNLRKRYPRGHLWGRNGTFRSVGDVDTQTVVEYSKSHNQTRLTHFI